MNNRAQEMIQEHAEAFRSLGHPMILYDFILKHGVSFTRARAADELGSKHECYSNSSRPILFYETKGLYAEGYFASSSLSIPILHGWIVDIDGVVLETTLEPDEEDRHYFGVVYDSDFVRQQMRQYEVFGILGGESKQAYAMLQSNSEEWKAEL